MSCTHILFNAHLRSDKRSISHKHNYSTHREILSYPARFVEVLRSLDKSWAIKLAEKLEGTRTRENSRDRNWHDVKEWSSGRPTEGRRLRKERRSISSPRYDGRRPSQFGSTEPAYQQQVRSRYPPLLRHNNRSTRPHDTMGDSNTTSRQRHQTTGPSVRQRNSAGFRDWDTSSEYRMSPDHPLRREKGRSVAMSAPSREPSIPSMNPFKPVPSSTYQHEPYVQSSRSRVNTTPVAVCHQDFPLESSLKTASRRRSPSAPRRSIAITPPRDHPSLNRPTSSTGPRSTPSGPKRRIQPSLIMKDETRNNSDPGATDRPPSVSRDRPEPSRSHIYFRGRRSRSGSKSLKVEFMDGQETYTLIDPRMTSQVPQRTESSSSTSGREERFTNLAYATWKRNGRYAQGEASKAHSIAQSLHDDLQCSPSQRLWLRFRSPR